MLTLFMVHFTTFVRCDLKIWSKTFGKLLSVTTKTQGVGLNYMQDRKIHECKKISSEVHQGWEMNQINKCSFIKWNFLVPGYLSDKCYNTPLID